MAEPLPQPSQPSHPTGPAQRPDRGTPAEPSGDGRPPLRVLRGGRDTHEETGQAATQPGQQPDQQKTQPPEQVPEQAPGKQQTKLRLPELPKLVPGVKAVGQMEGSAYKEPPWLLEREDSGYVQVTELLYKIAELCDGRHSYQEIADQVSEATGRSVSPENVAQLVAQQLLAKGLVADAEGRAIKPQAAARSLLAINGRVKLLGPEMVEAPTLALRPLFWPPVLLMVLAAGGAALWWLFTVHGVGGGVHQALHAPALMLPLFALTVISAAFHELGHATALRYGGGRVKGIGAGIYIVSPVLYTDVSDNYRLPRWSRVRTDLGGFYFNVLFMLGLLGAYWVTGIEFLLLVMVLISLDIVKQLLPFVRLDGYWTLVDVTGMPDFFSQMGAFLKSLVPGRQRDGEEMRELMWWAKGLFLLYILITVPFLAFTGFLMVRSAPRVLATAAVSAMKLLGAAGQAQAAGDYLLAAREVAQVALLAIPVLGTLFAMYRMALGAKNLIAKFSRGSWWRRALGSAVAGGLATGVVMLWLPRIPVLNKPGLLYHGKAFAPIEANERLALRDIRMGTVSERTAQEEAPVNRGAATRTAGTPGASTPTVSGPGTPAAGAVVGAAATATTGRAAPTAAVAQGGQPAPTRPPLAPTATSAAALDAGAPASIPTTAAPQNTASTAGGTAIPSPTRAIATPTAPATATRTPTPALVR